MNTKENRLKKAQCKQIYIELGKTPAELATLSGMALRTVENWIRDGKWDREKQELVHLEKQIEINQKKALLQGLKAYAANPENKDLQSLVSLLRTFQERNKPSQAYKENIIRFIDGTVDYFLEREMTETANIFKESLRDLAEYLLSK